MASLKCLLLGDAAVGKTQLLMSYLDIHFDNDYHPMILADADCEISLSTLTVKQSKTATAQQFTPTTVKLNLFDTSGREDMSRLRRLPHIYEGTGVILLCFSLVDPDSFEHVRTQWRTEIIECCPDDVGIVLVGMKMDMRNDVAVVGELRNRGLAPVTSQEGLDMMKDLGFVNYLECSATTKEGLSEVFQKAARVGMETLSSQG